MSKKEFGFDFNNSDISNIEPLVKNKKVTTERDYFFDNLDNTQQTKQGRPPIYDDKRFKATMPKRVSPIVNTKLNALEPLMPELLNSNGKASFNQMIDVLIESYINQRLSNSKIEFLRSEISEEIKKI